MAKTLERSADVLATARFRANPAFDLVVLDRLPEEYQRELSHLGDDPDTYGVLWPQSAGLTVKAVDRETALLWYTLAEPGPLPAYVRRVLGSDFEETIVHLVLDDALEVEIGGQFVSGAAAHRHLAPERAATAAKGRIAELSRTALDYGARIEIESGRQLALWLYHFNAVPQTPTWRQRLSSEAATRHFLRLDDGSRTQRSLETKWSEAKPDDKARGWRSWSRRSVNRSSSSRGPEDPGYKLYVSPLPQSLPETIPVLVEGLSESRASAFKIGIDLPGLLRPDKIVAYFDDFESLAESAGALQQALGDTAAQGVPFTAGIDAAGLLSWGMDPPRHLGAGEERESWRLWVINRLATALLAAKTTGGLDPRQYALERLEMEGVNTATWTPKQTLWETARS